MRERTTPGPGTWHRPLLLVAAVTAPFVAISLAGLALDGRVLVGAPIWGKPFKFAVSIVLYAVTWSWLVTYLPHRRLVRWPATVIAAALAVEYAIIVAQVIRAARATSTSPPRSTGSCGASWAPRSPCSGSPTSWSPSS